MECKKCQEALWAYYDGQLEEKEYQLVNEHLKICHECTDEHIFIQEMLKSLQSPQEIHMPQNIHKDMMAYIQQQENKVNIKYIWYKRISGLVAISLVGILWITGKNPDINESQMLEEVQVVNENTRSIAVQEVTALDKSETQVYKRDLGLTQLWQITVTDEVALHTYLNNYNIVVTEIKEDGKIVAYEISNILDIMGLATDLSRQSFTKNLDIITTEGENIRIEIKV